MTDLITLTGPLVSFEGATPLAGVVVTATPSRKIARTSDGEDALGPAPSETTDETGAFELDLVHAPGLRYTITYRANRVLHPYVLDCDSWPAGSTVTIADLPPIAGVPPSAVEDLQAWVLAHVAGLDVDPAVIEQAVLDYLTANPVGVPAHNDTTGRDAADAHPMASITGLVVALAGKQAAGSYATAAQGAKADTAVQPADLGPYATDADLSGHASDTTAVHGIADTSALVLTTDPRLADARTPTAHKATHATGGTDALTPADIGADPASLPTLVSTASTYTLVADDTRRILIFNPPAYNVAITVPENVLPAGGILRISSTSGTEVTWVKGGAMDFTTYNLPSYLYPDDVIIGAVSSSVKVFWSTLHRPPEGATNAAAGVLTLAGDLAGSWNLPRVVAASTTVAGKVELATTAEATTGTDTARAVTPSGVKAVVDALTIAAGVPSGGTTGQVLTKTSGTDYATAWETPSGGGSSASLDYVSLRKSTDQAVVSGSVTSVTWNSEVSDTQGYHDNSINTNRITIPAGRGGLFLVSVELSWTANPSGVRSLIIKKDGVSTLADIATPALAAGPTILSWTSTYLLAAGDYIAIESYADQSGLSLLAARSSINVTRLGDVS